MEQLINIWFKCFSNKYTPSKIILPKNVVLKICEKRDKG